MRTLCVLLLLCTPSFAQEQPQPSGKFYGPLSTNSWTFKPLTNPQKYLFKGPVPVKGAPIPAITRCAIPLVEMNVPNGTNYVIGSVTPAKDLAAPGWDAKSLIPACSQ
jgi:hypothetical protein